MGMHATTCAMFQRNCLLLILVSPPHLGCHSSSSASCTSRSVRRGSTTRVRAARSLRCPPSPYTYRVLGLTCTACTQTLPREVAARQARTSRFGVR